MDALHVGPSGALDVGDADLRKACLWDFSVEPNSEDSPKSLVASGESSGRRELAHPKPHELGAMRAAEWNPDAHPREPAFLALHNAWLWFSLMLQLDLQVWLFRIRF